MSLTYTSQARKVENKFDLHDVTILLLKWVTIGRGVTSVERACDGFEDMGRDGVSTGSHPSESISKTVVFVKC